MTAPGQASADMNSVLKPRTVWVTVAVLVAIGSLVVLCVRLKPPRQIITLANGDQYEFAGTYLEADPPLAKPCNFRRHFGPVKPPGG
jgi:hypothetical protein